jgi:hypothetical protein
VVVQKAAPSRGGVLGRRGTPDSGLADVDAELEHSRWMRGAPQNGLAALIRRIVWLRVSAFVLDRPEWRDRPRQWMGKPLRCHPITVAVLTSTKVSRS